MAALLAMQMTTIPSGADAYGKLYAETSSDGVRCCCHNAPELTRSSLAHARTIPVFALPTPYTDNNGHIDFAYRCIPCAYSQCKCACVLCYLPS